MYGVILVLFKKDYVHGLTELSAMMEISISELSNMITKSRIWLLSPWNVTSTTEELNFNF